MPEKRLENGIFLSKKNCSSQGIEAMISHEKCSPRLNVMDYWHFTLKSMFPSAFQWY
jgi:hypothetical protein